MNRPRDLESELRQALRREQPSAGFADRVMERLQRRIDKKRTNMMRSWMAIAAMLVAGVFITVQVREQERERHMFARKAAHDLTIALKITGKRLQATRMQIRRRSNGA